jgi:3-oxoacyl-[acyl-carrier protein] reductase
MGERYMTQPVVLVTGAGIGIGHATAKAFGRAGYHVAVTDILEREGEATAAAIASDGGAAAFHRMDVTDTANVNAVVAAVEAAHGALDCVVANAGIARRAPIAEMTDEQWDMTHEVNLKGVFRVARAALPGMRRARRGAIVAVSSISGLLGWAEHAQYNASKAGVIGLVRGLAVEVGPDGVRVNAVVPGLIRTAQSLSVEHSLGPEGLERAKAAIPLGRIGEPEDIADGILFLASDAARYVTGQTLAIDGGLLVVQAS